jgi:hypothetical protein
MVMSMFQKSSSDKLMDRLKKYKFSKITAETVLPIILDLHKGNICEMERGIASLAFRVCSEIKQGIMMSQQGDDYFSLIDLYLDDYYPDLDLRLEVKDIIFEGTILHDYGNPYGADLNTMEVLAKRVINQES